MKITGIILAGGLSSRMGKDKGIIQLDKDKMIEKIIHLLTPFCDDFLISANNNNYSSFGINVVNDKTKRIGPLGGIYSCMEENDSNLYVVMSCDTPNITDITIAKLFDNIEDFDVVVPERNERLEPLISLFSSNAVPKIKIEVEKENFKLQNVIRKLNYTILKIENNKETEKEFLNINTNEDLKKYYEN
ncbi:MAG: molybdenum cofactor guanylyltransferase [Flavobacteriales bacterium]|nr:molybdenum cofactor guanylyltransferase [Flavobacteriales bacterium]